MQFDYFYGNEAEQFTFYRIPKVLITSQQFKEITDGAKILYGLMLDRMSLSIKNGWFDEQGRAYIFYELKNIIKDMNCSLGKGSKMLAELDIKKGIGLIECIKQGQGNAQKIYLKKFIDVDNLQTYSKVSKNENKTSKNCNSRLSKNESQDFQNLDVKTSKNYNSRLSKNESADFQNLECNNNKLNNTELNENNTYPILSHQEQIQSQNVIGYDKITVYKKIIKKNIEYDFLTQQLKNDIGMLNDIVNIITNAVCTSKENLYVAGEKLSAETVKSQLLKLNSEHIEYVIDCMKNCTTDVGNVKQYMLAALYNAPDTMNSYYTLKANYDMHSGK